MKLSKFFSSSLKSNSRFQHIQNTQDKDIDALALTLAKKIVQSKCINCEHHFYAWKNKINNNDKLSFSSESALRAFLIPNFGDPDNPEKPINEDHLEGFIGEWLWYFLSQELTSELETLIHKTPPGFKATDPGADGFQIYESNESKELFFRLWEMKKFAPKKEGSTQRLNATIDRAYTQLDTKALDYLARITATEQVDAGSELQIFIGQLVDLWIEQSNQSSIGVSITTSKKHLDQQCFDAFPTKFPKFTNSHQLLGMATGVEDFSLFCKKVQEIVWKGL